jgi:hypothetical protein
MVTCDIEEQVMSESKRKNFTGEFKARVRRIDTSSPAPFSSFDLITDVTHPTRRLRRFAQIKNKTCVSVVMSATTPVAAR